MIRLTTRTTTPKFRRFFKAIRIAFWIKKQRRRSSGKCTQSIEQSVELTITWTLHLWARASRHSAGSWKRSTTTRFIQLGKVYEAIISQVRETSCGSFSWTTKRTWISLPDGSKYRTCCPWCLANTFHMIWPINMRLSSSMEVNVQSSSSFLLSVCKVSFFWFSRGNKMLCALQQNPIASVLAELCMSSYNCFSKRSVLLPSKR